MYSEHANHAAILIALAIPILAIVVALVKTAAIWAPHLKRWPKWQQALAVVGFAVAVLIGGEKPGPVTPPQEIVEILTMRFDGSLRDLSGTVASGVQARAVLDYIAASSNLIHAADVVIEQARLDCIALTNQLLTTDYDIAYLGLDMPRGTTTVTNHNILVSFQKVEQSGSQLDALVWFSEMPTTNVHVFAEYSIAEGVWTTLSATTNFWPATETVDNVECVRYRFEIPAGVVGTPLKPQYEVAFGGYRADQYLSVPETGVVVDVGGVEHLPYTGWDDYSEGTNSVVVRYVGGIAVEAIVNGMSIKGVN